VERKEEENTPCTRKREGGREGGKEGEEEEEEEEEEEGEGCCWHQAERPSARPTTS
jgi:hypothetical protein